MLLHLLIPSVNSEVSAVTLSKDITVRTPLPAGISVFVSEKPTTVDPPTDTVMPAASAAPPEPPVKLKPVKSNWKPATPAPNSYNTSTLPEESNAPNVKEATHVEPSPSQIPHSSSKALPPHSPAQSTSTKQLPSQSKFSAGPLPSQTPHSSSTAEP